MSVLPMGDAATQVEHWDWDHDLSWDNWIWSPILLLTLAKSSYLWFSIFPLVRRGGWWRLLILAGVLWGFRDAISLISFKKVVLETLSGLLSHWPFLHFETRFLFSLTPVAVWNPHNKKKQTNHHNRGKLKWTCTSS